MKAALALAVLALAAGSATAAGAEPSSGPATATTPDAAQPPQPAARWPDEARYELDLRYDARRFALTGTERISFVNRGPTALGEVWLRTWANGYGSCGRRFARVEVIAGGRAGAERAGCTALAVQLDRPLEPGARATIDLRLRIDTPARSDRFGHDRGIAAFGNALPILAVADASGWHLPPFVANGESFFSLAAAWDVRVRLPRGLAAATTGTLRSRRSGRLTFHTDRARDFALVLGRMRTETTRAGNVRIRHFRPRDAPAAHAQRALRTARRTLPRFASLYGPYAARELDIVQLRAPIGMEYPELVLSPPDAATVAHEIAHQWWYGIVGDDQYTQPWLDESFAEFSQARLPADVGGRDRLTFCFRIPDPPRAPLTAGMDRFRRSTNLYVEVVYIGGACTLTRLARELGRERFDRMIRGLVDRHRFGVLTTAELVQALREAAPPGFDVDRFLREARIEAR